MSFHDSLLISGSRKRSCALVRDWSLYTHPHITSNACPAEHVKQIARSSRHWCPDSLINCEHMLALSFKQAYVRTRRMSRHSWTRLLALPHFEQCFVPSKQPLLDCPLKILNVLSSVCFRRLAIVRGWARSQLYSSCTWTKKMPSGPWWNCSQDPSMLCMVCHFQISLGGKKLGGGGGAW